MRSDFDLAIVGAGFAGSLLAAIARRSGRSVILIEKSQHPRFTVGESSSPLADVLLDELTAKYDLPRLHALSRWGNWQRELPQIVGGPNRGFTFYHHETGRPFTADPERKNQLLVATSSNEPSASAHWHRASVDQLFTEEAIAAGVEYLDRTTLAKISPGEADVRLQGTRVGAPVEVRAKFVFDATGPRGFMHHAAGLFNRGFAEFPNTQALFSHFYDVERIGDLPAFTGAADPPYPVDDAAVHHVFDGGWMWVSRFNNGLTSAGLVVTDEMAGRLRMATGAKAWQRFLDQTPSVREQFARARIERPLTYTRRVSYLASAMTGDRWALLPGAAGFVDPLLSTGFPLTLLGIQRLAALLENDWGTERFMPGIKEYAGRTERELLATGRLVAGLYRNLNDFRRFAALSLLYFAASSFGETVRRLGKGRLADSFLLEDDLRFGPAVAACLANVEGNVDELTAQVLAAIEPFDVSGLSRRDRRNWYPFETDDLRSAAGKIGATEGEISELIRRRETA